jgi:O-antigen/teichoic acid export membrane protein
MVLKNKYFNNIATLFSGSLLASVTPILVAPILTRQYTPEDFGVFAFFIAATDILIVFSTLRLAFAIVIPKSDSKAMDLLAACVAIALIVSIISLLIALTVYWSNITILGSTIIHDFLIFIPMQILFSALYTTLYSWHNRMGRYKSIAIARVISVSSIAVISILFGIISFGPAGLIMAVIFGKAIGVGFLSFKLVTNDMSLLKEFKFDRVFASTMEQKKFPLFSVPAGLFNMFSWQVPAIMLKTFFNLSVLGLYDLCHRVLAAPTALIGTAIQDAFKVRAAQDFAQQGNCRRIYLFTLSFLIATAIIIFVPLYFVAPTLFEVMFGANWAVAGVYAQILIPFIAIRFVSGPLSYVLFIANKQQVDLVWQAALSITLFTAIYYGGQSGDPLKALTYLSYSGASMYFIYTVLSYYYASDRGQPKTEQGE